MAEFQPWCRIAQPSKPLPSTQVHRQQCGDIEQSRSKEEASNQPRPKSRLASYLSTHLAPSSLGRPSITLSEAIIRMPSDRVTPKDRDEVYDPNTEFMASAIRTQLLVYPTKDLPAKYNGFLLHILESHYRLSTEVEALHSRSTDLERDYQAEVERFQNLQNVWTNERDNYELRLAHLRAVSLEDKDRQSELSLMAKGGGTVQTRKIETGTKQLWPGSQLRSMIHLSRRLSSVRDDIEILYQEPSFSQERFRSFADSKQMLSTILQAGPDKVTLTGDNTESSESDLSSIEGDLLPDEEYYRGPVQENMMDHVRADSLATKRPEIEVRSSTSFFSAVANLQFTSAVSDRSRGSLLEPPCTEEECLRRVNVPSDVDTLLEPKLNAKRLHVPTECKAIERKGSHQGSNCRVFSFIPGDDARAAITSGLVPSPTLSPTISSRAGTPLPKMIKVIQGAGDGKASPILYLQDGQYETEPISNENQDFSLSHENAAITSQRGNSARSVMTAIKISSSHGPRGPSKATAK